jgi:hypothetical protein
LEPLRQLKITTYFTFTDRNGLDKDMLLKNGFLSIPTLIETLAATILDGNFGLSVTVKLYTDNDEQIIVANLKYNISNSDSFTYSYFRDSVILELKKDALFTKPFQELYLQANKLYFTGLNNAQILTNTTPDTIVGPGTFTNVFPRNTSDSDLGFFDLEPENEFLNFQKGNKYCFKVLVTITNSV